MTDGEQQIYDIGQEVFKRATSFNVNRRAFIKEAFPPLKSLTFLYNHNVILDDYSNKIWKFGEFKKYCLAEIDGEYKYQLDMRKMRNDWVDKNQLNDATDEFINVSIEDSKERVLDLIKKLSRLKEIKNKGQTFDLERVKQVPITDLMEFKGGFAKCLWHKEETGSLKYYYKTNTCYCFGMCAKMYDVIDVYQKLNNCSFKEAIKQLNGK